MNINSARLFVQLLEHIIAEDSSSINKLQGVPGAVPLLKALHNKRKISHDQSYERIKKVPWSELKGNQHALLLAGPQGAGVLLSLGDLYNLYVWKTDSGEMEEHVSSHGGRSIDWFQDRIGNINKMWLGKNLGDIGTKQRVRAKLQPKTLGYTNSNEFARQMLARFKPLWVRSLVGAQNDVKGWVNTQIKNDAFDKAKDKIDHLHALEAAVNAVELHGDLGDNSLVSGAIMHAVSQTTHMYYPEETGGFEIGRYFGNSKPVLVNREVTAKLFTDINNGDTQKLGTLLSFFRKNLVTG